MLNDEFLAGLTVSVPAHLPQSHCLQCWCAWFAVAVFRSVQFWKKIYFTG